MIYLGIDPGASGGLATIKGDDARAWKMPDTEADTCELMRSLRESSAIVAVLERVNSMPGNGVAGMFRFGQSYGFLRGLLIALRIPFVEVLPRKWQQEIGCMTGGDKNVSKSKAQQLWPELKITHATADALLLALYCSRLEWKGVAR